MLRPVLAVACSMVVLTACTSGSSPAPAPSTSTSVSTAPAPATTPTPVAGGPTTAADATSCPFAGTTYVHDTIGLRLGRLTVLRSGGTAVGCRFYAQQEPDAQCGAVCLKKEKLPGPDQPAVEIMTMRYASDVAAHNAFVLRAGTSSGITQTDFGGVTGLCFPTAFDPQDKGNDWACTVNKGPVLVLVRSVDTAHTNATAQILETALRGVAA